MFEDFFVSQAAQQAGIADQLGLSRHIVAVSNTRTIGKRDMIHNDALPHIEVDRQRRRRFLRSLAAVEFLRRPVHRFISDHDPAEVRRRLIEPLLHARDHRRRLKPVLRTAGRDRMRSGIEVASRQGPSLARKERVNPGRVAGLRRGVLEVTVGNAVLLQELAHYQKRRLLEQLRNRLPGTTLTDLRFRAGVISSP